MRFMIYDFKKRESLYCNRDDYCNRAPCNCEFVKCENLIIKKDE